MTYLQKLGRQRSDRRKRIKHTRQMSECIGGLEVTPIAGVVGVVVEVEAGRGIEKQMANAQVGEIDKLKTNQCLERTGCKSVTALQKGRKESALLELSVAPMPAFQVGR